MAKDLSLSSSTGHPASARTKFIRTVKAKNNVKAVVCSDSMADGHAMIIVMLPHSSIEWWSKKDYISGRENTSYYNFNIGKSIPDVLN